MDQIKLQYDIYAFGFFLLIRLLSVVFVQTFYEADEYWQSLEIAHHFVFGYGYLTWEWIVGIRSYLYPLIFAIPFKILELFGLDCVGLLIYTPRVIQAFITAYSDLCFYRWAGKTHWAAFLISTPWFWFYMGSRTLINSFETAMTIIALNKFPWPNKSKEEDISYIWLVAFICLVRPTASIVWFPLVLYHLFTTKYNQWDVILTKFVPIGAVMLIISIFMDSIGHGSFVITQFNFFKFNLIQGGASAYGTNPWHWYISSGLPVILGIYLIPFILASATILRYKENYPNETVLLRTVMFAIFILSFISHKEFRFLLPLLPMVMILCCRFLVSWSRRANMRIVSIAAMIMLIANIIPAYYLGIVHQRGTLDVMPKLRKLAESYSGSTNFLFLMPCHSTPLYSHIHKNISTKFLTCHPNLHEFNNKITEVDAFYKNPSIWLNHYYSLKETLPSHIILYNILVPQVDHFLKRYKLVHSVFHTEIAVSDRIGYYVLVYELKEFVK